MAAVKELIPNETDKVAVDLCIRGEVRLQEENTAYGEVVRHLCLIFRIKHWLKFRKLNNDARLGMCVARVAGEEIAQLRERIAELEAELEKLRGK